MAATYRLVYYTPSLVLNERFVIGARVFARGAAAFVDVEPGRRAAIAPTDAGRMLLDAVVAALQRSASGPKQTMSVRELLGPFFEEGPDRTIAESGAAAVAWVRDTILDTARPR